jgi:hypothetical protein
MDYITGIVLALAVGVGAHAAGFDKDRSFYATILVVIASYYLLFAAMTGSTRVLATEFVPFVGFAALAVVGARRWPMLVAIGLFAHGGFDLLHGLVVTNPGVPPWWPGFCLAYDVTAGAYVMTLNAGRQRSAARNDAPPFAQAGAARPAPTQAQKLP